MLEIATDMENGAILSRPGARDILPGSIDPRLLERRKAGSPEIALRRQKL